MIRKDALGYTEWSTFVDVTRIWKKTKNEDDFISLYAHVDIHETIHGILLQYLSDSMEKIVEKVCPNVWKSKRKKLRKEVI